MKPNTPGYSVNQYEEEKTALPSLVFSRGIQLIARAVVEVCQTGHVSKQTRSSEQASQGCVKSDTASWVGKAGASTPVPSRTTLLSTVLDKSTANHAESGRHCSGGHAERRLSTDHTRHALSVSKRLRLTTADSFSYARAASRPGDAPRGRRGRGGGGATSPRNFY